MVIVNKDDEVKRIDISLTPSEALIISAALHKVNFEHDSDKRLVQRVCDKLYSPIVIEEGE